MKIQKRDGRFEQLSFDKIIYRLRKLCYDKQLGELKTIDPDIVAQKVVSSIYDGVTSCELDEEAARIAVSMIENLEYQKLASRIIISNLHKSTHECFSEVMEILYNNKDKNGNDMPILADDIIEIVRQNKTKLNFAIDYSRDYLFDYFGFKTLEKSYLMKVYDHEHKKQKVVERPQHLYMRVALGIHKDDIESVLKTYNLISQHYYTHASPTMFNSGSRLANLSSCFHEDTIVATVNRGPVKIKDIVLGDQVITHNGNVKRVIQLHKNLLGNRKFYEINISKTEQIKVTDNHKLWVIRENKDLKTSKKTRTFYDIEFVRNFLKDDNCELISKEYKNMKTKLNFKCSCGRYASATFENIYTKNIRCNNRECIYERKTLNKDWNNPEWISVEELKRGDYVCIPNKLESIDYIKKIDTLQFKNLIENINNRNSFYSIHSSNEKIKLKTHWQHNAWEHVKNVVNCSREHSEINRYWEINDDFAKFIGIFYGDGHIITGKDSDNNEVIRGIGITIENTNTKLIEFCKSQGEKIFGIKPSIHTMTSQNIIQVLYHSNFVGHIFNELFGRGFNNKKIWSEMFKWDKNLVVSILEGLITTDGCISKSNCLSLQMSNVKFMRDFYYLLRNNNIDTSYGNIKKHKNATENHIQINIPITEINKKNIDITECYIDNRLETESIIRCKNQYSPRIKDGFKFLKFENKKLITENLPEYVYTLGVEDDHSYNVGGIIAENCFLIGTNDSIEGIYKTITDCGRISKVGGGIGVHISNIRGKGSLIRGTNGVSDGIIPMLKVYNATSVYVNQCITPDTIVYSKDGFKRMDEISTQDYLITNDGTFKKVNEVIVNKKDELIYEISNYASIDPLKCTKEHDIYVIKTTINNGPSRIKEWLQKGWKKPEFVPASEIKKDYYMGYPIPTYEYDIKEFTEDLCRLYGIMLGDGSIIKNATTTRYQITLNNKSKLSTKAFVIDYLVKNNIHYWIMNDCEICFTYNSKTIEKIGITENMLYYPRFENDKFRNKCIDSRFLHLPKEKAAMLIKGMIETDGCQTTSGLWYTSTDKNLIYSLKYLLLRFGILTSCQTINKIGQVMSYNKKNKPIISKKLVYQLRIPKVNILKEYGIKTDFVCQSNVNFFEWNGILFTRIKSIDKIHYRGEVYDFNMIDNHNYLTDMGLVHNSGKRKGSFAIYVEPWHSDILEFLDLKKNQGHDDVRARDLFYALWTPDLFMKQVEKDGDWYLMCPDECPGLTEVYGDEFEELYWEYVNKNKYKKKIKARDVWEKVLDAQIETGVPYIGYKDAVNKKCNQKNLGTIKSSNLCVAPETMILTSKGYYPIIELENKQVDIWNGEEWSSTIIRKTGENQELLKVKLSNNVEIECTPYHKFYIVRGKRPNQYPRLIQIEAQNLKPGMKLIKSNYPVIEKGMSDFPYPYEHGLFCADGTYEHNTNSSLPRITLYGKKKNLVNYIQTRIEVCKEDSNGRINCRLPKNIKPKYEVPINYDLNIKLKWLEGICDGDGTIVKSDLLTSIQISSINHEFLTNIKYLLNTLGCDPKIKIASDCDWRMLPNGKGNKELYFCQKLYRLLITSYDVAKLYELGFRPKRLEITGIYPKNNTKRWITVTEVEHTKRFSNTYCFKEEKRGMGVFNGVLTGQCIEISLYSDDKSYAVCNLCSLALPKYVEYDKDGKPFFNHDKLREVAEYVIKPMNKVIDNNYYPTIETERSNMAHRPLGIGIQGLADVYIKMRYPYESEEAKQLNKEIFETLYYGCLRGSIELAKKDGPYSSFKGSPFSEGKLQFDLAKEFDNIDLSNYLSGRWDWDTLKEDLKKYGARNSMLIATMPTASSAQIMNNSECFEAIDSCIFKRRVLSGEYMIVNKFLVDDLKKIGLWSKEMKDKIIAHDGSIQNIEEIPDELKKLYKTVWEISMKSVIEQCSDRGVFIDQMQSMNLFMANPNYKKLTSMHFYAWKNHLKSGMYYLRSKASASAGKFSVDPTLEKQIRDKKQKGEDLKLEEEKLLCSLDNPGACDMCSS